MIKESAIEKMSSEIKRWFAKAIVGMILADGRVDNAEIEYLNDIIGYFDDKEINDLIEAMVEKRELPVLEPIDVLTHEALEILKHLTVLSVVDEDLDSAEKDFLKYVATQLGLPPDIAARFLSLAQIKLKGVVHLANDSSIKVQCFDLSETGCMFYAIPKISPPDSFTLKLQNPAVKDEDPKNYFQPITAESSWCRTVTSNHGHYVIKAAFDNPINDSQGKKLVSKPDAKKS